ncbi:MAG TPA: D-alanyl-D-alanine carboxypeptidase/D-alanyl-D-alanine-endopeptidase, partial [Longimicrobium sp.]|nr:D-alanyl-D-alanine carboxypeptidase/D-alanyl-D-alanine-endopeptidase [Longimicrobium sp.]
MSFVSWFVNGPAPQPGSANRTMTYRTFRTFAALAATAWLAAAQAPAGAQGTLNVAPRAASGATEGAASPALAARIDAILERPTLRAADWGIEVRDAGSGRLLYARAAARPFIPASNLKLLVTATAAHHLDPGYRYRTTLHGTGPVRDGVLEGDLVLYGRGDPLISTRYGGPLFGVWEALADSLRARGVRRVSGGVVADDSYFEAEHVRADWDPYDLRWWYAAPVGALGYQDNAVEVHVAPGAVGAPPRVSWTPRSSYVEVENRAVTVPAGRPATADLERAGAAARAGIRVYGQVPAGAGVDVEFFAVPSGASYAGTTFRETLERKGIAVGRREVRVVTDSMLSPARGAAVLAEHWSDPLPRVIGPILL